MRSALRYAALTAAISLPIHDAAAQAGCAAAIRAAQNAASAARIYAEAADQAIGYAERTRQRDAVIEARRAQARANAAARKAQVADAQASQCGYAAAPSRPFRGSEGALARETAGAFIPGADADLEQPWRRAHPNPGAAVAAGLLTVGIIGAGIGMGRSRRGGLIPRHYAPAAPTPMSHPAFR